MSDGVSLIICPVVMDDDHDVYNDDDCDDLPAICLRPSMALALDLVLAAHRRRDTEVDVRI